MAARKRLRELPMTPARTEHRPTGATIGEHWQTLESNAGGHFLASVRGDEGAPDCRHNGPLSSRTSRRSRPGAWTARSFAGWLRRCDTGTWGQVRNSGPQDKCGSGPAGPDLHRGRVRRRTQQFTNLSTPKYLTNNCHGDTVSGEPIGKKSAVPYRVRQKMMPQVACRSRGGPGAY